MNYIKLLLQLYHLKRNTAMTRKDMIVLQQKKLRKILKYAYYHSEYYHKTFTKAGITAKNINRIPLSKFPKINKTTLIQNFDNIVTQKDLSQQELIDFDNNKNKYKKTFKKKYHIVHSSGSTGKPAYFVYDNKAWESMLIGVIRAALWDMSMPQILKYLFKKPRILYIAATDGRYGGAMAVGDGIEGVKGNQLFIDINMPLKKWIEKTKHFRPDMIVGYPSAIKILGELVESGKLDVNVSRVISCGEPLNNNLRQYFKKVFHSDVINFYGASESLVLGVEADFSEGMYLFDDMNYIEVENGNMYVTSLYNYVQPLIRYQITDRLKIKKNNEKHPFIRAENIVGREEDILWFENRGKKEFLHPLAIEGFCIEGLLDYQFRQLSDNSFEMLAQTSNNSKNSNIKKEILSQMKKILNEKHLEYVNFYIQFIEEILPDKKTGKKKLIVKGE